ncbi:MAG: hypothetical protein KDD42_01860 [Bdellovibrionales bacterium]|nr:hypothetical protein [Bdellovibrionales bacterium]
MLNTGNTTKCLPGLHLILLLCLLYPFNIRAETFNSCKAVPDLVRFVETNRGWKALRPIGCKELPKTAFKKRGLAQIWSIIDKHHLQKLGELYKLVGLIDNSYDFYSCYLEETSRHTEAFYDAIHNEIILPSWKKTPRNVLVHEIVHALQDQIIDLHKLAKRAAAISDQSLAFSAFIEGDASLVQHHFIQHVKQGREFEIPFENPQPTIDSECKFPPALDALIYFPYDFGLVFAERIRERKGWEALTKVYDQIPISTTQIIHAKAHPILTPSQVIFEPKRILDFLDIPSGKIVLEDTVGQYMTRLILGQFLDQPQAIRASVGWRGDKALVYKSESGRVLAWRTQWNSERDADEFRSALVKMYATRFSTSLQSESKILLMEIQNGDKLFVRSGGQAVDVVYSSLGAN